MPSPVAGVLARPSLVDYPGELALVFFLAGCNLRCRYCHNPDLWTREGRELATWEDLDRRLRAAREEWVGGVVLTGGEPAVDPDLARLVEFVRERGFRVKLDTNGTRPEVLAALLPQLGYVAMDYKAPLARYGEIAAVPVDTSAVARSALLLAGSAVEHEFRVTVLEGFHTPEVLKAMSLEIPAGSRVALQPFLPREDLPDASLARSPRTSPELLRVAEEIFGRSGQRVEIRGVVPVKNAAS